VTAAEVLDSFRDRFPDAAPRLPDTAPAASVSPADVRGHLLFLRDTLRFDHLVFVSALDLPDRASQELVYRLFSYETKLTVVIRVLLPREGGRVETVSDIYRTAEWHERETAEMFGIDFAGHPDPRKLLLPDDIDGHPLRKDFTHPNMIPLPEVE
jgi:NADH-quinone oxidoreductase subunit C